MNPAELFVLPFVVGAVVWAMIPLLTKGHVTSWRGLGAITNREETSTRYHQVGFVILGLVAVGDAFEVLDGVGSPWGIAFLLGALTGLFGHGEVRNWTFVGLSLVALVTSGADLAGIARTYPGHVALVTVPLLIGVAAGALLPRGLGLKVLAAKGCALVVLARFALSPFGLDVLAGAGLGQFAALAAVGILGGVLLAAPGTGVSLLLGIGVGLSSLLFDVRTGSALGFVVAFLIAWGIAAALRTRFGGRRRRAPRSGART